MLNETLPHTTRSRALKLVPAQQRASLQFAARLLKCVSLAPKESVALCVCARRSLHAEISKIQSYMARRSALATAA